MKILFGIGIAVTYVAMAIGYFVIINSIVTAVRGRKTVSPDAEL